MHCGIAGMRPFTKTAVNLLRPVILHSYHCDRITTTEETTKRCDRYYCDNYGCFVCKRNENYENDATINARDVSHDVPAILRGEPTRVC